MPIILLDYTYSSNAQTSSYLTKKPYSFQDSNLQKETYIISSYSIIRILQKALYNLNKQFDSEFITRIIYK